MPSGNGHGQPGQITHRRRRSRVRQLGQRGGYVLAWVALLLLGTTALVAAVAVIALLWRIVRWGFGI